MARDPLDFCHVPKCTKPSYLTRRVRGKRVGECQRHWIEHCRETQRADLHVEYQIGYQAAALEAVSEGLLADALAGGGNAVTAH